MNLTLLPTDLKLTDKGSAKSPSSLNDLVNDSHSPKFGQLLDAKTASMQKRPAQADKHSLKEGNSVVDKTAKSEWSQLQSVSDKTAEDKLQKEITLQENNAEFTLLKDDDLLSADALNAVIPIQIAGLVTPPAGTAALAENTDGLAENELLDRLLDSEGDLANAQLGKSPKDARLTNTDLVESPKESDRDEGIHLSAARNTALNHQSDDATNTRSALIPAAGQIKLASSNKAEFSQSLQSNAIPKNAASSNGKELNLLQAAIQAVPALTAPTAETTSIDSPAILAASPLFSAGQHVTGQQPVGQFQLSETTAPLLNAHLGSEEWQQQLNRHVLFFNRNGLQQAELRLHPQELGALHIRMSVEDNQAQLHFVSAHQNVRAALEAALPGLRHALAENGIQLAQSSVNSDAQGNWQQEHHATNHTNGHSGSHEDTQSHGLAAATGITASPASAMRMTPQQLASTRGGIDTFA
ncbi:flagellar hook-length control protein FliK [Xenorhabdus koppenhoeferi]|uniref:Flagellar hook-length control protein FliK n=1 Tax=Xenorhabdus koppenhoeferi TaxID=351659 RepID=A0A1I7F0T8_9GAMM|nr:flagellar hook-length control protein FliK [Xenorhabdus koppenhoeferi]SFU29719.1 flagellar hook-length control protein FliK [Xenorhabdus koppenhoeferi]